MDHVGLKMRAIIRDISLHSLEDSDVSDDYEGCHGDGGDGREPYYRSLEALGFYAREERDWDDVMSDDVFRGRCHMWLYDVEIFLFFSVGGYLVSFKFNK